MSPMTTCAYKNPAGPPSVHCSKSIRSSSKSLTSSFPLHPDVQQGNSVDLKSQGGTERSAYVCPGSHLLRGYSWLPEGGFCKGKQNYATQGSSPTSDLCVIPLWLSNQVTCLTTGGSHGSALFHCSVLLYFPTHSEHFELFVYQLHNDKICTPKLYCIMRPLCICVYPCSCTCTVCTMCCQAISHEKFSHD